MKSLTIQQEKTKLIGQIAFSEGMLDEQQIFSILNHQADKTKRFLETAVELTYLTREESEKLLAIQTEGRPRVGEILVAMNEISRAKLDEMQEEYHRQHSESE